MPVSATAPLDGVVGMYIIMYLWSLVLQLRALYFLQHVMKTLLSILVATFVYLSVVCFQL